MRSGGERACRQGCFAIREVGKRNSLGAIFEGYCAGDRGRSAHAGHHRNRESDQLSGVNGCRAGLQRNTGATSIQQQGKGRALVVRNGHVGRAVLIEIAYRERNGVGDPR